MFAVVREMFLLTFVPRSTAAIGETPMLLSSDLPVEDIRGLRIKAEDQPSAEAVFALLWNRE
jgi:hypothetical protein